MEEELTKLADGLDWGKRKKLKLLLVLGSVSRLMLVLFAEIGRMR